jgi:voltage-gated potassium channel
VIYPRLTIEDRGIGLYSRLRNRILTAVILYLGALITAILALMIVEGWPLIDSIYMSILTLTTVGYGEVRPLSQAGKLMMSAVMLVDNAIFLYAVGSLATFIIEGYIRGIFRENKLMKKLNSFSGHYIVVGYGRLGQQTAQTLVNIGKQVVAVDIQEKDESVWKDGNVIVLKGDGREESVLKRAGVERASGLSACLPVETDNLVIIITAKEFNPDLQIVARASTASFIQRLNKAGAEEVVIPELVAGKQIAFDLVDPNKREIARLMELPMTSEFQMREVRVTAGSPLVGKSIMEAKIRQNWGVFIAFIGHEGEAYDPHPDPHHIFQRDDSVWIFGQPDKISEFIREAT